MVHSLSRLSRRDDGAVAIISVVLISVVFIALCALVVDLGMARDTRRQAQNTADASALAAGNVLYNSDGTLNVTGAISAAKSYALTNYGVPITGWAGCADGSALTVTPDTVSPANNCISFDSSSAPTTVRVNVPVRQVPTPFAQIWGVTSVPVGASAQIQIVPQGLNVCGLCVIGQGSHNMQNGSDTVHGANVAVNGQLATGPHGIITDTTTGDNIYLQGTDPGGCCSPAPKINQPVTVDPLANLIMPDYSALTAKSNSCASGSTGGPGIYATLSASSLCTMQPGLYVITGDTHLSGGDTIVARGVTLYFVCSTSGVPRACNANEPGAGLIMSGSASLEITAPTSGPNQGLSIVTDRKSTATISLRGNGGSTSGTIYIMSGTLDYRGNGGGTLDSLVVVGDMSFSGSNAAFVANDTAATNVHVAPIGLHLSR